MADKDLSQERLSAGDGGRADSAFPSYNPLPSMPRLAAAYTPKRLSVPFLGIKRQLGETYLESRLEETHLEHECRRETPRPADLSPYLNKLTRVR